MLPFILPVLDLLSFFGSHVTFHHMYMRLVVAAPEFIARLIKRETVDQQQEVLLLAFKDGTRHVND
jgi:hypothetical protein